MGRLTFLRAVGGAILAKRYSRRPDGSMQKEGAPRAQEFTTEFVDYHDAESLFQALDDKAKDPSCCLVRGKPAKYCRTDGGPIYRRAVTRPGYAKSDGSMLPQEKFERSGKRANVYWLQSLADQPTDFVCLDVDGGNWKGGSDDWIEDLAHTAEVVRDNLLPAWLHGVSCWVQATGSALDPSETDPAKRNKLRLRLAFKLKRGLTAGQLRRLFDGIENLDRCTLQVHQPIYTAHPVFAPGCYDHLEERSAIAWGERDEAEPPAVPAETILEHSILGEIEEAKEGEGLANDEAFEEVLGAIDGTGGRVRSGLIRAATLYAERHGAVDLGAMENRLTEAALEHRDRAEVAGYGIPQLVSWAVAAGQAKRRARSIDPEPEGAPFAPFEQPAEAANDDSPEPAEAIPTDTAEEASTKLACAVRSWVQAGLDYHPDPGTAPPRRAIRAAAGLGKTTVTLEALAELAAGKTVHFYVPTHALAGELRDKAAAMGIRSVIIQGRGRDDPDAPLGRGGTKPKMCLKSDVAEVVAKAGIDVWDALCESRERSDGRGGRMRCEHFESCSYVNQFKGIEGYLIILVHNYLSLPRRKIPVPSLVVIDERFYTVGIRGSEFQWSRIVRPLPLGVEGIDYQRHQRTAEAVSKALWNGEHVKAHGVTIEDLDAAAKAESAAGQAGLHTLYPAMGRLHQWRLAKEHEKAAEFFRLAKLYRILEADFDQERATVRAHVVKGVKRSGELMDVALTHYSDFRMPGAPTLLIDADADPLITSAILPGVEFVEIKPPMQAHVTQVTDTFCGRRKLTEDSAAPRSIARIIALATRLANQRKRVLLVGYKPVIEAIHDAGGIEGVSCIHFGNLRGLDAYKDFDAVIIAGREQTRAYRIEVIARALFGHIATAEPMVLPGEYQRATRRYLTRDGHARFGPVDVHPDPRVQAVVEQGRECETVQAVARLRLIHRVKPAEVFLLSMMPVPLIVDQFVTWDGLLPNKAEEAAQESGGVELLSPSEMARCHPEKWPSKDAAKKFLQRQKLGTYPRKICIGPRPQFPAPVLVAYRAEATGTRGPAPKALIPGHLSKLDGEAALAAVVGPLLTIDYAPDEDDEQEASA